MTDKHVIGTSGSADYLRDETGDQRFWAVSSGLEQEESCDGLHDEAAPIYYLCTKCFPDLIERALRGDLAEPDDEYRRED